MPRPGIEPGSSGLTALCFTTEPPHRYALRRLNAVDALYRGDLNDTLIGVLKGDFMSVFSQGLFFFCSSFLGLLAD